MTGIFHPLDVIKTRFQSSIFLIKAMMGKDNIRILYQNIKELLVDLPLFINNKELKDYLKDFIFQCLAKHQQPHYFFGCKV